MVTDVELAAAAPVSAAASIQAQSVSPGASIGSASIKENVLNFINLKA